MTPALDLSADVVSLTEALINMPSESHHEQALADEVERALSACDHLEVIRLGNSVVARTHSAREQRVVLGGHLDTVPSSGNDRAVRVAAGEPVPVVGPDGVTIAPDDRLYGLGASDMKGGVAVILRAAVMVQQPRIDVTYVFYECEEVAARHSGLTLIAEQRPDLLHADFAVLMEPSESGVEAGCQGTLRADIHVSGRRAHSARGWLGSNAIHAAGEVIGRLASYEARRQVIDGLEFREGLNAVAIRGGVAGNVIPDECVVTVNFRYAPDRTAEEAEQHVREVFAGFEVTCDDNAPGALPRLDLPAARDFVEMTGVAPRPKFGWTDVARFAALGVPALNFGPASPTVAHAAHEFVSVHELRHCDDVIRQWLSSSG